MARLLPDAEFPEGTNLDELATAAVLRRGREVLLTQCTRCHDLRIVLERPRSPRDWSLTVERMGEMPAFFEPMRTEDLHAATAYLIAITPDLQHSAKQRRAAEQRQRDMESVVVATDDLRAADGGGDAAAVVLDAGVPDSTSTQVDAGVAPAGASEPDPRRAEATYRRRCSGCHALAEIEQRPPRSRGAVRSLVRRMVENGLEASRSELTLITWWLERAYVR